MPRTRDTPPPAEEDPLLLPAVAAKILGISASTLRRRSSAGLAPLPERRTREAPGGHRRYRESVVRAAAAELERAAEE